MGRRYGVLVLGKRSWQIASAGLMLLSLVLALGIVWMSARSKVIPYIVEVDRLGYALMIPTLYDPPRSGTERLRQILAASRLAISL